jgi:hypothetical protein
MRFCQILISAVSMTDSAMLHRVHHGGREAHKLGIPEGLGSLTVFSIFSSVEVSEALVHREQGRKEGVTFVMTLR